MLTIYSARFTEAQILSTPEELRINKSYTYSDTGEDASTKNFMNDVYLAWLAGDLTDNDDKPVPVQLDSDPDFPLAKVRVIELVPFGSNAVKLVVSYVHYRFVVPGFPPEYITDDSAHSPDNSGYQDGDFDDVLVGPAVTETQTTLQETLTNSKVADGLGSTTAIQEGSAPFAQGLVPIQVPWAYSWLPDTSRAPALGAGLSGYSGPTSFSGVPAAIAGVSGVGDGVYQPVQINVLRPIQALIYRHYIYLTDNSKANALDKQVALYREQFEGRVNESAVTMGGVVMEKRTALIYDINATTPDNGNCMLIQWRIMVKPIQGGGLEGSWDPWVSAIDPRTGTIPWNARKVMGTFAGSSGYSGGYSGYYNVNTTLTNGFARIQDPQSVDFTTLPWFADLEFDDQ